MGVAIDRLPISDSCLGDVAQAGRWNQREQEDTEQLSGTCGGGGSSGCAANHERVPWKPTHASMPLVDFSEKAVEGGPLDDCSCWERKKCSKTVGAIITIAQELLYFIEDRLEVIR